MRQVSTAIQAELIAIMRSVTDRIIPVRPMPPTVAQNSSSRGVRVRASPRPSTSSSRVICPPMLPSRWWFLPWTSAATAPPRLICRVPGVTGTNQPAGTTRRNTASSLAPAPQVSSPVAESTVPIESSSRRSSTVPPAFWAASP